MSTLSIRSLPKPLERALIKKAKQEGKTKTQIVIEALQSMFQLGSRASKKNKIRQFFGKMTKRDYQTFRESTKDFSKIDNEFWK